MKLIDWIEIFQKETIHPCDGYAFAKATRWQGRPLSEEELFRGYGLLKDERRTHADNGDGKREFEERKK